MWANVAIRVLNAISELNPSGCCVAIPIGCLFGLLRPKREVTYPTFWGAFRGWAWGIFITLKPALCLVLAVSVAHEISGLMGLLISMPPIMPLVNTTSIPLRERR